MNTRWRPTWALALATALGVGAGFGIGAWQHEVSGQDGRSAEVGPPTAAVRAQLAKIATAKEALKSDPAVQAAKSLSRAFRNTAGVAMPSVVKIHSHTAIKQVKGSAKPINPFKGTPFEDMLPPGFAENFGERGMQMPSREGIGSGVIIDKSGTILTNNHVVEGADELIVTLSDGREFKASNIKTDPLADVAVIQIQGAGELPAAKLGNSDELEIGDWVLAIGNPFELEETVSAGIISAKGRSIDSVRRGSFLQTDAAINPGNSGGPLVNLEGEVVGINTAIASNSGGYQGIGFAIPINKAKWIADQLLHGGSVHRGYLGIRMGGIDSDVAQHFGLPNGKHGPIVGDVLPNSPAAKAGVQEGDVIQQFAGKPVTSPRDLQELVEVSPVKSKQPMIVFRDGKSVTLTVTIEAMPEKLFSEHKTKRADLGTKSSSTFSSEELGLNVRDLTEDDAAKFSGRKGVVVTAVEPGSPASEKRLEPDMLITRVDRTTVHNLSEFSQALKKANLKEGVLLQVRSTEGGSAFVVLKAS